MSDSTDRNISKDRNDHRDRDRRGRDRRGGDRRGARAREQPVDRGKQREQRAKDAKRHVVLMKSVFGSEIKATIEGVRDYQDGIGRALDIPEARFEATQTSVSSDFIVAALYTTQGKAAVVDPAAFTRPAGNYEDGSFGPEQAICSESTLYPVLCGLPAYYKANRGYESGQLFTDHAMYLSDVIFSHGGQIRKAGVVVVPAPNRRRAMENNRAVEEIDATIGRRVETIMRVAAANGVEVLICGAFACGAQGYDAAKVAAEFKKWIDTHPGVFKQVLFAVPRASQQAFEQLFGAVPKHRRDESRSRRRDDDAALGDDDIDLSQIELPEGITLR